MDTQKLLAQYGTEIDKVNPICSTQPQRWEPCKARIIEYRSAKHNNK